MAEQGFPTVHRSYDDIISRIPEAPIWWQENGVPRYNPFHPHWSTGVYTSEAVLAEVACQACETTFLVCIETTAKDGRLAEAIRAETLEYGDPPNVLCCGRGHAMSTGMIRIVEYWRSQDPKYARDGRIVDSKRYFEWVRSPELEIAFSDPWGDGDPNPPRGSRWKPDQQRLPADDGQDAT